MIKTYVPQLAKMALRMSKYITTHQSALNKHITDPTTRTALTSCATCLQSLSALLNREQP